MRIGEVEGIAFPPIEAETLSGEVFNAPDPEKKTAMVLFIAFRRKVQEEIDAWFAAVGNEIRKTGSIQAYEVPMLSGGWKMMSGIIDGGMRSGIPADQHGNVATYYGRLSDYRELLHMKNPGSCYVFIVDKEGIIRFAASGAPKDELASGFIEVLGSL